MRCERRWTSAGATPVRELVRSTSVAIETAAEDAVIEWFGGWPNFHDAEVVSLILARSGESMLRVYPYYPAKPAMVDFVLEEVTDLELADFSVQNVISGLSVEGRTDQTAQGATRISMGPCFGLSGWIDAKRVRLQVIPGQPSTS